MSSAKLQGRVAIITGASRGIGKEIALTLASHGASVVVCFQGSVDKANEVVDLIKSKSGNAIAVQVDVSREADVKALFDKAEEAFGSVHILVNSAGILLPRHPTLEDTTLHEWEQTFAINSRGSFLPSREAAKRLVRGGGGRIVNLSTSLVAASLPGYGAYTVSKAGIEALTKILTKELKGRKITVNAVAPGPVATDLFYAGESKESIEHLRNAAPLERLGEPKDIAALVLFLASDDGEWVNGQVIRANGGFAV